MLGSGIVITYTVLNDVSVIGIADDDMIPYYIDLFKEGLKMVAGE